MTPADVVAIFADPAVKAMFDAQVKAAVDEKAKEVEAKLIAKATLTNTKVEVVVPGVDRLADQVEQVLSPEYQAEAPVARKYYSAKAKAKFAKLAAEDKKADREAAKAKSAGEPSMFDRAYDYAEEHPWLVAGLVVVGVLVMIAGIMYVWGIGPFGEQTLDVVDVDEAGEPIRLVA
jgi:ElaB/YqjD/DUF883 family membrane-anchored ribosome-binding protein